MDVEFPLRFFAFGREVGGAEDEGAGGSKFFGGDSSSETTDTAKIRVSSRVLRQADARIVDTYTDLAYIALA